ncbi:unnamed protein product [Phytophthora lilii]|uniref:Unnamed protein product n=1 Tax=Phytophthora lilii TaxID=2077276 RepID=A0A9W6UAH4_9STRA|nr:unnamed protein product [Phytophthora lilii]
MTCLLELLEYYPDSVNIVIEDLPEASSPGQWIFEVDTHEKLCQGGELDLHPLAVGNTPDETHKIVIERSETTDVFAMNELSLSMITRVPYHRPESKMFESVDSFYLRKVDKQEWRKICTAKHMEKHQWGEDGRLLLFRLTLSKIHPVDAHDIICVLSKLGYMDKLDRVALVFVTPCDFVQDFKCQRSIQLDQQDHPTPMQDIRRICAIARQTASVLTRYGVATIVQLKKKKKLDFYVAGKVKMREQKDKEAWKNAVTCWEKHGHALFAALHNSSVIKNISQFVCSLDDM